MSRATRFLLTRSPVLGQLGVHARATVGLAATLVCLADQNAQALILTLVP
jgi:hypothetical protein